MGKRSGIDFGLRSDDYAEHRPGFPASFYDRLTGIFPLEGASALDLGTGPGIVALELARRGADVVGLDIAQPQLDAAKRRAVELGLEARTRFELHPAEQTALEDASVDFITAGQCWPWFDNARALAEAARVLKPGGHLVVAHLCYLPHRSRLAKLSEDLVVKHNPAWKLAGWHGIFDRQIDGLQTEDLRLVEQFCYDYEQPFSHTAWRGRMRTCNGVGSGGMSEDGVQRYDADLARLLKTQFSEEPVSVVHRVWAVVCRRRPTPGSLT